jgi:tetratricopeptide (TPR) repeat protein
LAWSAPDNITAGELALLPPYCKDVQVIDPNSGAKDTPSPRAAYWVSVMGQSFWAMHHYCWGLIHVHRSHAPGLVPVQRIGMIGSAIGDYQYVLNNSPRDFVLAPEVLLRLGEAEQLRGNPIAALEAFAEARTLRPDYWPAYTRAIDLQIKLKQRTEAKALAAEGLRFAPASKELQSRYRSLGGDPATVPPSPAASSASAAMMDAAAASPVPATAAASEPGR